MKPLVRAFVSIVYLAFLAKIMTILDVNQIRQILPHRYPFLLVDRIIEMDEEHVVGIKNVTVNEPFFLGHFPDFPVMPGVLIVEAMAQTAGVQVLSSIPDRDQKLVFLVSVDAARFRKPVVPGDQLRIEMTVIRRKGTVAKMAGHVTVDGVAGGRGGSDVQAGATSRWRRRLKCRFIPQRSSIPRHAFMLTPKLDRFA